MKEIWYNNLPFKKDKYDTIIEWRIIYAYFYSNDRKLRFLTISQFNKKIVMALIILN